MHLFGNAFSTMKRLLRPTTIDSRASAPSVPSDPRTSTPTKAALLPSRAALPTVAARSVTRSSVPELVERPADVHAARFLHWLIRERGIKRGLLFDELLPLYSEMIASLGWSERPWNPVGAEIRKLLGGKKSYVRITDRHGTERRLRIYYLSEATFPLESDVPTHVNSIAA